ncbi:hypothetical protein K402DRAFT_135090 [Aulographum hederae CBS 113979]|uniref:Uncharacterized protein n=1 Tax=Aulographum hederae CBS 113979 TaxID=1176131 RepID=A0A6G1GVG9_9PEZI|nr:hypothetical protein K402DRAFT_135090 [Aulographum hederae CBS 113979]
MGTGTVPLAMAIKKAREGRELATWGRTTEEALKTGDLRNANPEKRLIRLNQDPTFCFHPLYYDTRDWVMQTITLSHCVFVRDVCWSRQLQQEVVRKASDFAAPLACVLFPSHWDSVTSPELDEEDEDEDEEKVFAMAFLTPEAAKEVYKYLNRSGLKTQGFAIDRYNAEVGPFGLLESEGVEVGDDYLRQTSRSFHSPFWQPHASNGWAY